MTTLNRLTEERKTQRGFMAVAVAAIVALALLPSPIHAAPGPPAGADRPPRGMEGEDLRETIEIYMLAKMKRELELTQEQEEAVVPLVQALSASRHEERTQRRLTVRKLGVLLEDPASSEAQIEGELASLREGEISFRKAEQKAMDGIREALTPRQEGRFVLFIDRFMQDMQRRLQRMRQMDGDGPAPGGDQRRRRGGGRPGGPEGP
jgi:Spy/CpxP family protein refolding chaperone